MNSTAPSANRTKSDGEILFDNAMRALEAQITNAGTHLAIDTTVRNLYAARIFRMSNELRQHVLEGRMTWKQAAEQAQETRNALMETMRGRSTPVGNAIAEKRIHRRHYMENRTVT